MRIRSDRLVLAAGVSLALASCSPSTGSEAGPNSAAPTPSAARNADASSPATDAGVRGTEGGTTAVVPGEDAASPRGCDQTPSAAPASTWVNVTGNLAGMSSECGNLTLVSATTCSARVIAGVANKGLWATNVGSTTWTQLGKGSGSATITNRPSSIVYDPVHAGVFWESGIYNGGGVYRTKDDGQTFEQLGTITHDDLVSVDLGDAARGTLLVGGHEQKRTLHRSTDGGKTWTNVGINLPADAHFSSYPVVVDAMTHLVGACGWGDGTCGIWRTTNGGQSWTIVSDQPVTAAPLRAADGAIYWPLGGNGIAVSRDGGATFTRATTSNVTSAPMIELPDARLVAVGQDHLMISADGAKTWSPIGETLPFAAAGVAYAPLARTFFVWHWDCGNVVLPNAIMSAGFGG